MLAHGGLSESHMLNQVTDPMLPRGQMLEYGQPCRIREPLEKVRIRRRRGFVQFYQDGLIDRHTAIISLYDDHVHGSPRRFEERCSPTPLATSKVLLPISRQGKGSFSGNFLLSRNRGCELGEESDSDGLAPHQSRAPCYFYLGLCSLTAVPLTWLTWARWALRLIAALNVITTRNNVGRIPSSFPPSC